MEDQETVGTIGDGANDRRSSVRQAAHQADEHTQISAYLMVWGPHLEDRILYSAQKLES